jgi:hypothetical protein
MEMVMVSSLLMFIFGSYTDCQILASYDFNSDLTEPIMKHLANNWEKAFARRVPSVLQSFTRKAKAVITTFHREVEERSRKNGAGAAGLSMLSQQLRTYEATFSIVTSEMAEAVNNLQRDANREFVPVVAARLASAYQYCVNEHGMSGLTFYLPLIFILICVCRHWIIHAYETSHARTCRPRASFYVQGQL